MLRQHGRLRCQRVHVFVVEQQRVHLVGQAAGGAPGHADDHHLLAHGAQRIDHVQEVRVPRHQHEGAYVGVRVSALDAIGGHLDVDAVLDAVGAHPVGAGGMGGGHAGWDKDGLDACRIEGGRVVDELAGPAELGRPGHPVGVGLGDHHPALVGYLLLQRGEIGVAVACREADLEVFPVNEQGDVAAANGWFNHASDSSGLAGSGLHWSVQWADDNFGSAIVTRMHCVQSMGLAEWASRKHRRRLGGNGGLRAGMGRVATLRQIEYRESFKCRLPLFPLPC